MEMDCDKVSLIRIKPEVSSFDVNQNPPVNNVRKENIPKNKTYSAAIQHGDSRTTAKETVTVINEAAEERQRTGRYLAIGVTLVMLFIAFYHTLLRHATFLAGLLAPAIIMLLYILWLFYFAKKKKYQVSTV